MCSLRVVLIAALFATAACKDPTGNNGLLAPTEATLNTVISGEIEAVGSFSTFGYRVIVSRH